MEQEILLYGHKRAGKEGDMHLGLFALKEKREVKRIRK